MPQVSIKQSAPNFTLADFRGKTVSLSDFQGKYHVVLVFNRGFA